MPKTRPADPESFRWEALGLVRDGRSIPDVAESLGVSPHPLRNWRRQGERGRRGAVPGSRRPRVPARRAIGATRTRFGQAPVRIVGMATIGAAVFLSSVMLTS